jgi:hypothetical protein
MSGPGSPLGSCNAPVRAAASHKHTLGSAGPRLIVLATTLRVWRGLREKLPGGVVLRGHRTCSVLPTGSKTVTPAVTRRV